LKFAHIADCHLGGWRDPKLRQANADSFSLAIDKSIEENVDFVIIAGDLFNSALPSIDCIRLAVLKLKELHDAKIPVYGIPGSHDYSPSGKTMIDVLESAGLFVNVAKGDVIDDKLKLRYTVDPGTGAHITGIFGRKGGLDKYYYEDLARNSERIDAYRIFCFHCALTELKPSELYAMDAMSVSLLPKGFNYYAGGHVHIIERVHLEGYASIVYPGPTFPNSFSELEKLGRGNFCIVEDGVLRHVELHVHPIQSINLDCHNKTTQEVEQMIRDQGKCITDDRAIVTLRLTGTLREGKPSDIPFNTLLQEFNVHVVIRNTAKLTSREFEEVQVSQNSIEEIERTLILEHAGQSKLYSNEEEVSMIPQIMRTLAQEKHEGMKRTDFEKKIIDDVNAVLDFTE
jgi:DNA repair exonuclease SbcCD nuclease subunit